MQHKIKIGTILLVLVGCLIESVPAHASDNDKAELAASDVRGIQRKIAPNEVTLAGKTLFRVPTGAGGLSAAERADVIRERLEDIATHYIVGAGQVTVTESKPDTFVIAIAGESLATVEPTTAKAAGAKDAATLADTWADKVRENLPTIRMARQIAVRPH